MIWALIPLKFQRWIIKGTVICAIVLIAWFGVAQHYKKEGAAGVLAQSKKEGIAANAKNAEIRAAAEQPGAAGRVRNKFCRDC
jgi:hypothetical protein